MRIPHSGGVSATANADSQDMADFSRDRIARRDERGFTLIELLVVLIIISVLLAIAVPSFLGFKDRAQQRAATANVRSAIPSAEAYFADVGNYTNMKVNSGDAPDTNGLESVDTGVDKTLVVFGAPNAYCISDKQGTHIAKVVGPGGTIDPSAAGACSSSAG
jgi:type IV pilus assembly protein PilA